MNKKTILVVDDENSLVLSLKIKLTEEGYEVLTARDGKEGLNIAKSNHPDLILLDILMPVMDGLTMLRELRRDEWGKTAKVLILSNLSRQETELQSKIEGVTDYIIKSNWDLEDLAAKIRVYLKN